MDLTNILMQSLGNGGLEKLSNQAGMEPAQTKTAMAALVPTLLTAMAKNSTSQDGAKGLLGALDRDHDGSILDDIGGYLSNTESMNGNGILNHVLGNDRAVVEEGVANKLGVNTNNISKLLPIVAPMVMAYLGRQKRQTPSDEFNGGDVTKILANIAGNSRQNDGIDIGDIMNIVGGLSGDSKSNSGGGFLGGLLKNVLRG